KIDDVEKSIILANNSKLSKAKLFSNYDLFSKLLNKFSTDEWVKLFTNVSLKQTTPSKNAYNTLINHSIKNNHFDVVKQLALDTKINFNEVDNKGFTALQTAIISKKQTIINYLINTIQVDVNKKSKHGYPLSIAVQQCNL